MDWPLLFYVLAVAALKALGVGFVFAAVIVFADDWRKGEAL
jgi:hypothetical protein